MTVNKFRVKSQILINLTTGVNETIQFRSASAVARFLPFEPIECVLKPRIYGSAKGEIVIAGDLLARKGRGCAVSFVLCQVSEPNPLNCRLS